MSSLPSWKVVMFITGYGNEPIRDLVKEYVDSLGFQLHVYDHQDYSPDPGVHSHEACVRAIYEHDIVLALLDTSEGGMFQVHEVNPAMAERLRDLRVLPPTSSRRPIPTITQVEVLTARALGKPVLAFMTRDVEARLDQTFAQLQKSGLRVKSRVPGAPPAKELIRERRWQDLLEYYEIPAGRIASDRHLLFLDELRKQVPNWVTSFDKGNLQELRVMIRTRLAGVAKVLVRHHADALTMRLQRARGTLAREGLRDLLQANLILEPPFRVESGTPESAPLYHIAGNSPQVLSSAILAGKNVLLLGDPGHGKSTGALLAFRELVEAAQAGVEGYAPLYLNLRDLPVLEGEVGWSGDVFLRTLLALPSEREAWPESLELPQLRWLLVLDGADESQFSGTTLRNLLQDLPSGTAILLTCRETVFEREYSSTRRLFDRIIVLQPWDRDQVQRYAKALRAAKRDRASQLVERYLDRVPVSEFISIPLWLSMLAFLAERLHGTPTLLAREFERGYDLLRICASEVARDEAERHGVDTQLLDLLERTWREVAWMLRRSRSERKAFRWLVLRESLGVQEESALERAVLSVLDVPYQGEIRGFFHEVFFEYWLAEYIVSRLVSREASPVEIAELFIFHHSYITNRLVRERIESRENPTMIAARLREAYYATEEYGDRQFFARNQIIYLVGRVDRGEASKQFVRAAWYQETHEFVKYAAGFSGAILGDSEVESAYYYRLKESRDADEVNRAYHLAYYEGTEAIDETASMPRDRHGAAALTLKKLFDRLRRGEARHRNLRRIELFTIRRFLETGRIVPLEVQDPASIILNVRGELEALAESEFRTSALEEADAVLYLLTHPPMS